MHFRGPDQVPRARSGTCQGLEDAGNAKEETAVNNEYSQHFFASIDICRLWEEKDCLDMGGNRRKAS